jgi:hypothetical protein
MPACSNRHPNLTIHMSHLGGGLSALLGRIRSYQDKEFWGTLGNARHGMKPKKDFDYYLQNNMVFDTAGSAAAMGAVKGALIEIPASRIVSPPTIRRKFVSAPRCATSSRNCARSARTATSNPVRQTSSTRHEAAARRRVSAPHSAEQACASSIHSLTRTGAGASTVAGNASPARCIFDLVHGKPDESLSISACTAARRVWEIAWTQHAERAWRCHNEE